MSIAASTPSPHARGGLGRPAAAPAPGLRRRGPGRRRHGGKRRRSSAARRNSESLFSCPKVCSINSVEPPGEVEGSGRPSVEGDARLPWGTERAVLEDNLFLPSGHHQGLSNSFSQSAEIFQELQQECMRRLNVPTGGPAHANPPPQTLQSPEGRQESVLSNEDRPQIPPRVPLPPRPVKRGEYAAARWSRDLSLAPAEPTEDASDTAQDQPPQVPPRDPLSQPGSRTPSPLVVGSPHQRVYSVSPTATPAPAPTYGSYLSTSPGQLMPTTHSFASDPKYAAPKVIQAQGKEAPSRGPCILPIVRDGRKVSNTHYYLLPERPPYLDRYDHFFREAEHPPLGEEKPGRQANTATVRPMVVSGPAQHAELKANFSSNNNSSLGGPRPGVKTSLGPPMAPASCGGTDGGGNSADRVRMVSS